jgi:hypothetical protein
MALVMLTFYTTKPKLRYLSDLPRNQQKEREYPNPTEASFRQPEKEVSPSLTSIKEGTLEWPISLLRPLLQAQKPFQVNLPCSVYQNTHSTL